MKPTNSCYNHMSDSNDNKENIRYYYYYLNSQKYFNYPK